MKLFTLEDGKTVSAPLAGDRLYTLPCDRPRERSSWKLLQNNSPVEQFYEGLVKDKHDIIHLQSVTSPCLQGHCLRNCPQQSSAMEFGVVRTSLRKRTRFISKVDSTVIRIGMCQGRQF